MRVLATAILYLLLTQPAAASPSTGGRAEFEVLRNGQSFGRQVVTVSAEAGGFVARNTVSLRVGAGPLTLFRYEQTCDEHWSSGVLTMLNCSTLKEGRRRLVRAQQVGGALRVTGPGGEVDLPADTWPTSWWTKPPVGTDYLLNTETGARAPLRVRRVGAEMLNIGGRQIRVDHLRVEGTLAADLWYDEQGRWVGCAFNARGQSIQYRLVSALTDAPA